MILLSIQGIPTENEFALNDMEMRTIGLAYSLSEDLNSNGIPDYKDFINSKEGYDPVTPVPTSTPVPTVTDEPTTVPTTGPDPTITDIPEKDLFLDSDGDGLSDYEEFIYGTNNEEPDSDFDGICDLLELQTGYDPNDPDSDNDMVLDGDEDYDEDGLTNSEEGIYGTCIFAPDSDYDGINDHDEILVYNTNPRNEDTNGDGIIDGDALKLGLDPNSFDSDNDGILDIDEKTSQSMSLDINEESELNAVYRVEVSGSFTNLLSSTMKIEDMYGKDVYCSSIDSLVGGLISIETTSVFDNAVLSFFYDDDRLNGTNENDLMVLWYDEETGLFIEQSQATIDVDTNTITVELEHFSTYFVADRTKWNSYGDFPGVPTITEDDSNYDFYFLMDMSQMMSMTNRENALELLSELVDSLRDGDRILPILYDADHCYFLGPMMGTDDEDLEENLEAVEYYMTNYFSGEYASMTVAFNGIEIAQNSNKVEEIGNKRHMFILTGGLPMNIFINLTEVSRCYTYLLLSDATASIISMNPGDPEPYSLMDPAYLYSFYTESDCFYYDEGIDIWDDFSDRHLSIDLLSVDADGDGIPDYVERVGMICMNRSIIIKTRISDEDSDDDGKPDGFDSDKDGLSDGKEAGRMYTVTQTLNQIITISSEGKELARFVGAIPPGSVFSSFIPFVPLAGRSNFVFTMKSNPKEKDSDHDDYTDSEDARPWTVNPEAVYLFTNPDWYDNSLLRKEFYEAANLYVIFGYFDDCNSFLSLWQGIGEKSIFDRTGLYYYTVRNVVICSHGDSTCILLDAHDSGKQYLCADGYKFGETYIPIKQMSDKKIKSLNLYACSCGEGDDCIAEQFLKYCPGIEQVIAADSTLYYFDNVGESRDVLDFGFTTAIIHIITDDQYKEYESQREYYKKTQDYYSFGLGNRGFLVFSKDRPVSDLYVGSLENDVLVYNVYTTQELYDNGIPEGLYIEPTKEDLPPNTIKHDPILG